MVVGRTGQIGEAVVVITVQEPELIPELDRVPTLLRLVAEVLVLVLLPTREVVTVNVVSYFDSFFRFWSKPKKFPEKKRRPKAKS